MWSSARRSAACRAFRGNRASGDFRASPELRSIPHGCIPRICPGIGRTRRGRRPAFFNSSAAPARCRSMGGVRPNRVPSQTDRRDYNWFRSPRLARHVRKSNELMRDGRRLHPDIHTNSAIALIAGAMTGGLMCRGVPNAPRFTSITVRRFASEVLNQKWFRLRC